MEAQKVIDILEKVLFDYKRALKSIDGKDLWVASSILRNSNMSFGVCEYIRGIYGDEITNDLKETLQRNILHISMYNQWALFPFNCYCLEGIEKAFETRINKLEKLLEWITENK